MRAFAVFEGGGARGFAHIGALQAAEERGIKFERVAGTSIGAVVAALVAAGYSGEELFHIDDTTGQRQGLLNIDPIARLRSEDWERWLRFRADFLVPAPQPAQQVKGQTASNAFHQAIEYGGATIQWIANVGIVRIPIRWLSTGYRGLKHRLLIRNVWQNFGVTGAEDLRHWLDGALRSKLGVERPVTFGDLKACPLKVVATDLISGEVRVFGGRNDATVPVADAVVASATFPLFFRPTLLLGGMHVDGGLLSNLPAWVFDDEISTSPERVPIIGFRLREPAIASEAIYPTNFMQFLSRLIRATIFGARQLESRGLEDYYVIDLPSPIETLAFDQMQAKATDLVIAGREGVKAYFNREIGPKDPNEMREVLSVLANFFKQTVEKVAQEWRGEPRCALLIARNDRFARVAYSSHRGADDGLSIRMDSPGPAACFSRREPVTIIVGELNESLTLHPSHKVEHALRPTSVQTVCALPIFENAADWGKLDPATRAQPLGVLVLDAESNLLGVIGHQGLEDVLAGYAQIAGSTLTGKDEALPVKSIRRERALDFSELIQFGDEAGIYLSSRKERDLALDEDSQMLLDRIYLKQRAFLKGKAGRG